MLIRKRRIIKIDNYLGFLEEGSEIIVGLDNPANYSEILSNVGFTEIDAGYSVLPSASLGTISEYNAEGKIRSHKDQPMENVWHMVEWTREEWRGRDNTETVTDVISRRYKRYPITLFPPPGVELTLQYKISGELVLTSPPSEYVEDQKELIRHKINLFLEIFGECNIFSEDLSEIINAPVRNLNWRTLPPGPIPWEVLYRELESIVETIPANKRTVFLYRLRKINEYRPKFVAVGNAGFAGYVILGFENKDFHVCESLIYGNATYIFGENWEAISQLSKAEILRDSLHRERIIHRKWSWLRRIRELLS